MDKSFKILNVISIILQIVLVIKFGVEPMLFLLVILITAEAVNEAKSNYVASINASLLLIISVITGSMLWLLALVPLFFVDILMGVSERIKAEDDYVWKMNNGPSTMARLQFHKTEDDMIEIRTWEGGTDGYYKGADGKRYNRYMQEIKDGKNE